VEEARTRYTTGREPCVAYQVVGEGEGVDVVLVAPLLNQIEHSWTYPTASRALARLAGLGRLILYDRREVGLSDPSPGPYTLADEVDDLVAVMDAAGVGRGAIVGWLAGGPVACLLAGLHPERVGWLVLDTCVVRELYAPDYDWAPTVEERAAMTAQAGRAWGEGDLIAAFAPDWAADAAARAWRGRMERAASSPATMRKLNDYMNATDVRGVLPSIRAPTLVVRRRDDVAVDRRHSVYVAEHIDGAVLEQLDGRDSAPWGYATDEWVDLIGRFVTGRGPPAPPTRALVTLRRRTLARTPRATRRGGKHGDHRGGRADREEPR